MARACWGVLSSALVALLLFTACKDTSQSGHEGGSDDGSGSVAERGGDKDKSIKAIMVKMHGRGRGDRGVLGQVKSGVEQDAPDWAAVQDLAKDYRDGAETVAKLEPSRGEKDSWNKLTAEYVSNAKAMDEAAHSKDKEKCLAAEGKLEKSCMSCHSAHRGRGGRG